MLFMSPSYEAWMVTVPAVLPVMVTKQCTLNQTCFVPVYLGEQVLDENETAPVPFTCDHVTFPVGMRPVTITVHLTIAGEPASTDMREQLKMVFEGAWATGSSTSIPEEAWLWMSPE